MLLVEDLSALRAFDAAGSAALLLARKGPPSGGRSTSARNTGRMTAAPSSSRSSTASR